MPFFENFASADIFFRRLFLNLLEKQESKTIDIFSTVLNSLVYLVIITHSISDHLIYFVLEDFIKPLSLWKSNTYKWSFKNFDKNKLKEDSQKIDNNINDACNSFNKTHTEILDRHTSLTKIRKNERTLYLKPWKNKEIQYLMWKMISCFERLAPVRI